jgi:hypothetical protein
MIQNLQKVIHTKFGQIAVSIILGLGLASLFRKVCDGANCLKFQSPSVKEVEGSVYEHNGECYKFKAKTTECSGQSIVYA